MRYIITADDFGMSKAINSAIFDGISMGIINTTNIMVNMPYANEGKKLIGIPELAVGIHYNLTTGSPITNLAYIPSLVDENGKFWDFDTFKRKYYLGKIRHKEIILELRSQLSRYIEIFGMPDYWNTHNHIQMMPPLFKIIVDISREFGITKMRNNHKFYPERKNGFTIKNAIIDAMYLYATHKGCTFPDGMVAFPDNAYRYSLDSYICSNDIIVEVVIHVADECDSEYFGKMKDERIQQKKFYLNDKFKDVIENQLISYFFNNGRSDENRLV